MKVNESPLDRRLRLYGRRTNRRLRRSWKRRQRRVITAPGVDAHQLELQAWNDWVSHTQTFGLPHPAEQLGLIRRAITQGKGWPE